MSTPMLVRVVGSRSKRTARAKLDVDSYPMRSVTCSFWFPNLRVWSIRTWSQLELQAPLALRGNRGLETQMLSQFLIAIMTITREVHFSGSIRSKGIAGWVLSFLLKP
jgi:hypothetical protein